MKPSSKRHRLSANGILNYGALEPRQLLAVDVQIGEVGTTQVDHNWQTIDLDHTFSNPVVIAGPASSVDGDPLTIRVRNVSNSSFQLAIDEWDYLDGNHPSETVSYLVVEEGTYNLTDGTRLVAGYVQDQTHDWKSFSTGAFFDAKPVLFSQIATNNDASSANIRTRVLGSNDFEIRIQEEEGADDIHGSEMVGFVAMEVAFGTTGDLAFQSFATPNNVTHDIAPVPFATGTFETSPAFFAEMQTYNGVDVATVRYTALDSDSASIFAQEEQSSDAELIHAAETVGVLAIENGALMGVESTAASDRFIEIEEHILGIDSMTVAQLQSWSTTFQSQAGNLGNNLQDFVAAVAIVDLYEDVVGPLFTSAGQASFASSWDGETNVGRALARTMLGVYQAVFDAIDRDLVAQEPAIVNGVMFRSTENFPGSVPYSTDPASIYEVQIDGTLSEEYGSDGGYNTNAARRMTGAYLAPGTIAEVIVPNALVNAGFQIRVGGHSWDLSSKNTANRLYRVSNTFAINDNVVRIANPMGGNVYIEVPIGADVGVVDIQFRNTIRAPFFSNRSFDQTSQTQWENVERNHPGAFTDIESEHSMWTVPTKWVGNLGYDALMNIIAAHDANIQVASEYVGKNTQRHKAILYMIVDTQIRGNAFSIGYPQSNYGSFAQNTIRAPLTLNNAFDKVLWHEHGHAEFMTMFAGESESWIHMLAVNIGMENYGMTAQEAFAESLAYGSHNHDTTDTLHSWVVMDEFINGQNMAFQQGSYRPRGHADYVEYVEMFGLEAMQNFNRRINIEMDGLEWTEWTNGRTNHNYNDRILRLSREAGVNVAPLFHLWGHAPSNASALATAMANEGLGDSVQIYDRMVAARDTVPLSQAQWNAVDSVMRDFLNNDRGPWVELRANYDVARGQAAIDRIQALIDLYFPGGRPADGAVVPIAASVVAFADSDFSGTPWELAVGTYINVDLDAGPIGNDAISSFLIPEGYEVTVYQWSGGTGNTATYTDSVAALGLLDDDVSRIEVTFTLNDQLAIGESDTISLDDQWKTVTLTQSYNDPVVIAGTPSYTGTDPSTVRIRNVTSNSFEIQIDEWEYLAPAHSLELVSYMVVESGEYTLNDGTIVVAGNKTGQEQAWQTYDLGSAFDGLDTPIVLANVVTENDPTTVATRVGGVTNSQFLIRLQEEESSDGVHGAETISYFAVQSGAGATGGLYYDAGTFSATHTGQFENFDSGVKFSSITSFFAAIQTFNGSDTTALRRTVLNATGTSVFLEEEKSGDAEISHGAENLGFFAINRGLIMGAAINSETLIESRGIFYGDSSFGANELATDKAVLLPGETATFENYSSYFRGINGLVIDVTAPGNTNIGADDFEFRIGNSNDVESWTTISPTVTVTVEVGAGENGTDRVQLVFDDNAIVNTWLQITFLANSDTGLATDDVFYFGNAIGESGNSTTDARVNLLDVALARSNQSGFSTADIENDYDFDRDGRVNLIDVALARSNQSGFSSLQLITPSDGSSNRSSSDDDSKSGTFLRVNDSAKDELPPVQQRLSVDELGWRYREPKTHFRFTCDRGDQNYWYQNSGDREGQQSHFEDPSLNSPLRQTPDNSPILLQNFAEDIDPHKSAAKKNDQLEFQANLTDKAFELLVDGDSSRLELTVKS